MKSGVCKWRVPENKGGVMYIPEFWVGVIVTIVVEFLVIMLYGIFHSKKK